MWLQAIPFLVNRFLMLPRLGNIYLSQSAYSIMSDLFSMSLENGSSHVNAQLSDTLTAILSSPPSKSDSTLSPAWVQVLGNAMLAYAAVDADACANEIGKVWKAVWNFLESNDPSTRKAASQSLAAVCRCFTPMLITAAYSDETSRSTLGSIIAQTTKALRSLTFAQSMPQLLSIISSLIMGLQYRAGSRTSPTAAERLLLPVVGYIGELRVQKGFEYKEDADATLATAMRVLGPEVLLGILQLNLEPSDRYEAKPYYSETSC
jgi:ribosomal RNA-processing protein 12